MTSPPSTPSTPSAPSRFASGREPLYLQAVRVLRDRILRADLPPGNRLTEVALTADLGMSRTPVRQALAQLAQEGFLTTAPGRGYTVVSLSSREVRELFAVIGELEVTALRWAGGVSADVLGRLTELNARLERAPDVEAALAANGAWHRALVSGCPNVELRRIIEEMRVRVYRYEFYYFQDVEHHTRAAAGLHRAVMSALAGGDLDAAASAIRAHWLADLDQMLPDLLDQDA